MSDEGRNAGRRPRVRPVLMSPTMEVWNMMEFPAFFAREGQSSLPPLPPPPPIPEWLDEAPHVGHRAHFTGAWYCDTCDSPYCDLA